MVEVVELEVIVHQVLAQVLDKDLLYQDLYLIL